MNRRIFLGAALAGLVLWSAQAGAWTSDKHWDGTHVTLRASKTSFPAGNAYRSSLGTIVQRFNINPSDLWYTTRYDDTSCRFVNGQEEIWFTDDSDYAPAMTISRYDLITGHIWEADVLFYNGENYTTSMTKTDLVSYGGSYRPFQTTALHEYGHVAGLGHENDEYNIMGEDWTHIHCNGQTASSYLGEDAASGLISLYTREDDRDSQDVSVSLFKYYGEDGEYSEHTKCKMYDTSGVELTYSTRNGQRRYNVSNGQRVRVEFTYENSGETTKTGRLGFYLSTDSTITTADTLITTRTFSLTRDDVVTQYNTITLPSTMTAGTVYYLGVIIDDNSAITEVDERNAAYHIIRVN